MSNIHDGPLATYNPLTDRNLAGYFGNTRMRRHLRKAGLINHRGEIISENQYRVNMARKEHKKHVKELLAQAIVHKTLDLERYRQVEIKRKLEEIAKIELVRRVRAGRKNRQDACLMPLLAPKPPKKPRRVDRDVVPRSISQNLLDLERPEMKDNLRPASIMKDSASRGRKGDEEVLPYLTPRSMSRPQSERPSESSSVPRRPKSAPAPPRNRPSSSRGFVDPYEDVIYVDDDGRPVSPPPSDRASSKDLRTEGIDTRHLYALDSEALHQYALKLSRSERGRDGATSPYLISQFPVPPKSDRVKSARSPRRSARMSARPEGPAKERRAGVRQSDQIPHSARKDPDTVEFNAQDDDNPPTDGALMLHRQEPAMMHQGEVQTLCEIQMKYHGPNLTLPRDQHDPTQEVAIEQQHCGGNTLPVFRERLQPGKTFSFISRRHRGYPFSLTLYIDGRVDCRISTCCEYKHGVGVRLGGKMGHFSLTGISGATPCYKCKLSCQAPPRSLKLKKTSIKKKKERAPEPQEEVTVDNTPRSPVVPSKQEPEVNGKSDDEESYSSDHNIVISVEEDGDQSKTEMSVKGKHMNKDKFVPQNPEEAKSGLTPLESSLTVKESKVEVETNSDLADENESEYKDDFEDDKNPQSEALNENSSKENKNKFDDNNFVAVNGYEHTEIATEKDSMNDTENDRSKKPIDYQDTDYEIEEDIFSEQAEMLKDPGSPKDKEGSKATEISNENDDMNCREPGDITATETVAEEINTELEDLNVGFKATSDDEFLEEDIQTQSGKDTHQNTLSEDGQLVSSICSEAVEDREDEQTEGRDNDKEKRDHIKTPGESEKRSFNLKDSKNANKKDNYEDDFEDEGVNIPVPIDIKSARDIEILNQVNKLGKRVILETSEGAPENISVVIEYNNDSDIVLVKKYRPVESIDVEGILMDTLQTPGIPEALEEEDSFCDGEEEDHVNREAEPVEIKPKKKKSNKAASSVSSMSVSSYSRGKGSSSNQTITHSAPEWLDSLSAEERSNRHLIRPKTAWGHSSTSKVRPVKKLRPITSRKEISQNEKYDMEFLRAKFYPPPHNCLDKPALGNRFPTKRKRPEKQRAEAVQFKNRNKLTDHDISLESHPDTLAKTENFIETLIAGVSDPSQSASLEKKAGKRSPGLDCETADEVSDIEPDYPITPVTRPIEVNININKKKKPIKKKIETTGPSKHPSAKKEKVVEGPGVSVAYAKHILKHKNSNGKDVKDMVNINIQTPTKPRGRSPPAHRRGSSPKRARSPSPKRVPKLDLTQAKKDIDVKVEDGKAEIEKLLQECLDTFGLKLQEQQRQFAEQLQLAHDQFAEHLNQAQSALTSHGDDIQGNLSIQLQEATEVVAGQLKESQATLNQQLESSQKTLVDQLTESQTILAQQFKESQTTFGELVSNAQTVIADQLKDSQNIFGEQVQDSQKLLSEQLNESQKTLTNQMKDSQDVLTNQLKDSQQAIADQVKESQQMIADQLKQSQETIAEQLKMSQTTFANQLIESQTALSNQLTESQGQLSNQLSTAQQTIADDLTNAQETIAKQVEENQKILSDQLITSQEKIDNQLHDTQAKISDQLVDTKRQIDEHLLETLETIGKQENEARERLKKDSEETHKNIKQQEEIAKMKLQKESEDSQKRLAEQEEATREKLQKEADETRELLQKEAEESRQTLQSEVKENREMLQKEAVEAQEKLQKETDEAQKRFAEQESKAKEEMEKERAETQRRLEEQEKNARNQLLKESEATQKRLAEQEAQAKEQLQKEGEETQKRLAEQELKAKEEMKKESEETARKLAAQEASAMASMKKESEETARRLQEQEQKAREELKKESEESARKFAEQEQAAREQLKKESEETQKRLVKQEELTKEALKKESELTAQRLAEQEASARESLMKEGQESAKRLAEQEQKAREEFQKESAESAKRLADQEAKVKQGLKQELDASKTQLTDAMKVAKMDANRNYMKTKNKYEDDFEPETEDRRQIIGLQVDEDRENGQTVKVDVKEKEEEEAKEGTLPEHRRIEGYSSEDEDLQGGKEPFKVSADVHETQKKERKLSTSSSSSASSRSTTPVPAKVITAKTVVSPVREDPPLKSDRTDTTERSTTSTTSGSLTTATESTLEPRPPSVPKPQRRSKTSSSSSSSNSSTSSDTEDEKYKRKKRDKRLKEEAERMKRELEEKEKERNQRQEEEEQRRKQEEEERKRRFEEEDRRRREELEKREEERRQRDLEIKKRKAEEERKRQEEQERRRAEEERIHAGYQKQLLLIKQQRESDDNIQVLTDNAKQSNERSVIEIESKESLTTQTMAKGPEVPTEQSDTESTTTGTTTTTESESGQEKEKPTIAPIAPMSTITEEKEKQRERHSSSSSSGSSSTSDGEYDLSDQQQKKEPEQVKAAPVVEAKVEVREEPEKLLVPPPQQKVSSTEESSSSSGSSTETESDEDNKKVETPKETVVETRTVVQEETPKQEVPAQQPQEKDPVPDTVPPPKQPPATNSSSGETTSSTETDAESTPRPKMEQQKVPSPIPESVTMLRGINTKDQMPQSVTTETEAEGPKKEETEDSSSDSSSGSSSDSDSETETDDKKPKPGSGGPVSESDGENMHGGNDPENVAEQINKPDSRLAQSSVKPPVLLDGSILPLIKDQTTVEINGVQLDDEQVTELCNYIAEKDYISSLTVRNAGLDDMAFQNVALSLQVSLSSPTLLNFSQNKLSGKAMSHLSPAIKKNSDLGILILNGNPIGSGGCKVIVDGILKAKDPFPFLRRASGYLTLSEARAQEAEGKTVDYKEPEPENNCTIKELDLGDTNMSEAGILEISRLLENNKTLVSLNLNGNTNISVKGWERLGEALKENTSLKTLSLDFTNLGDEGLECLVKGLQVNTGLRALELESAGLTEKGGQLLLELLKSNTSILELTATTGNNISDSTLAEIRKYLKLNNTSSRQ